ncbi:hypothetical protein GCM10008090_01030 [Arenicella chitinivorans]|uniref:DNA topoisomerase (ATP-hydrolyzing) n=2 Tax=Arenicella chitinivorans TaxID=1329800 RepID=A0A918RH25_9GAMM|nr:hypothetical protein GCM10008090_01030 [Arenicella chitinivorans]
MSKSYDSNEIEVLKGLEPVRRRPSMYLGELDDPKLNTMLAFQALCHAADEFIEGNCSTVKMNVSLNKLEVWYDAGMPLDPHSAVNELPAAIIFLSLHMGCHNQKKNIKVGDELCKLGLATLNAVCSTLVAKIRNSNRITTIEFKKGVRVNDPIVQEDKGSDFTRISIELDSSILPNTYFDLSGIEVEARRITKKFKLPIEVEYKS